MTTLNLRPTSKRAVDLLLDPNNPRFSKHHEDLVAEDRYGDPEIQELTLNKMLEGQEVDELENSILSRGFTPVDNIFIKKINILNFDD